MKARSFFSRVCDFGFFRHAAVMLTALAWSTLAFCDEINDAAKAGDLEKVRALLKSNPDIVSSKDNIENTPLHYAAMDDYKDVAELLLTYKAEVNAANNVGLTPLHMTALRNNKDVAELLLANGAKVDALNENAKHLCIWRRLKAEMT